MNPRRAMSEHNMNHNNCLPSTSTSPQPTSSSLINFPSTSVAPKIDLTRTDNADNKRTVDEAFSDEEAPGMKSALRNATALHSSDLSEDHSPNTVNQTSLPVDEKPAEVNDCIVKDEKTTENTEEANQSSVEVDAPIILLSATAGPEVKFESDTGTINVVLMTLEAFTTYHPLNADSVLPSPVSDEEESVKPVIEEVRPVVDEVKPDEEEKPAEQTAPTVEFPPEQEEQPVEPIEVQQVDERNVELEAGNGDGAATDNAETRIDEAAEGPQGDHEEGPIVTEPVVDETEITEPSIQVTESIEITTVTLMPGELTLDGKDVELSALKTAFPTPFIRLVQQHPRLAHMVENHAYGRVPDHDHAYAHGEELADAPSTGSVMSGVSDAPTSTTVDESGSAESLVKSDHEDQQNVDMSDDVVNMKALAELIDSSTRNCSYSQGYVKRQLVYSCRTCILDVMDPAGMCLACALNCHEDHDIVPMLTRRNFRCDCGNSKFGPRKCQLIADKDRENSKNVYNDNFHGVVCTCKKSLAGTTASTGNLTEVASGTAANVSGVDEDIVQCRICEEQYHASHIGVTEEDFGEEWEGEMVCRNCLNEHDFLRFYQADLNNPEAFIPEGGQVCTLAALKRKFGEQQSTGRSYVFSGSWWENLCRCSDCQDMYRKQKVDFLLDPEDTFASYEEREGTKEMENVQRAAAMSPEEIFAQICEGFDSITQVELAHWFNNLREVFVTFLQSKLSQGQQTITDADIEEFFATFSNMQEDREEDDCDLI